MTGLPSLASNPTFAPTEATTRPPIPGTGQSTSHLVNTPLHQIPSSGSLSLNDNGDAHPLSSPRPHSSSAARPYNALPTTLSSTSTSTSLGPPPSTTLPSFVKISTTRIPSDGMVATFSMAGSTDWEATFLERRKTEWGEKVDKDMRGWRGGNGVPRSSYPRAALPTQSYYGQPVTGSIGVHLPKEIVRIERDWSGGEVCQFESAFPMELEGRITPAKFSAFIESLNDILVAAYSVKGAVLDNVIGILSLWTSLLWRTSTFERELNRVEETIREANVTLFNPAGVNVLSPRDVALQFLEIEYY